MGTRISHQPSLLAAGETSAVPQRWKKNRLVKIPISRSKASATKALSTPMPVASAAMGTTLQVVVKSPSRCDRSGRLRRFRAPVIVSQSVIANFMIVSYYDIILRKEATTAIR